MRTLAESKKKNPYNVILLLVLLAICFRSYQEYLLADFPPDKRIQTATALNLASGNGISISYADANDLSKTEYEKIGLWPPGFPVALAALMGLNFSFFQASFILEFIAIAVLFFSLYGIFRQLEGEIISRIAIFFILFQAFTISVYKVSFTNDLIALSFAVCALYLLLKVVRSESHPVLPFFFGLISFMPSFFRFSYYPVSLLFPLLLFLYAVFIDSRRFAAALIALTFTGSLIALQLFYQSSLPTGLSYLDEYHPETFSGPHWGNLGMFSHMPAEILTNKYLFKQSLDHIHPTLFRVFGISAWFLFLLTFLALCFRIMGEIKKFGRSFFLSNKNRFLVAGLVSCLVVTGFLSLLSLRYPAEPAGWMPENRWTYVAEARYFNLVLLLFPLLILTGFQDFFKVTWIRFTIAGTGAAFIVFSMGVNFYYIHKYSGNTLKENASIYYHYHPGLEDYLKERKSFAVEESLVFGPEEENGGTGIYASLLQIPLFRIAAIEGEIRTQNPVCILLNVHEAQSPEMRKTLQSLIQKHQLQPVREFPELQLKLYELCLPGE